MKKFIIRDKKNLKKWMSQNNASIESFACGCLVDNLLVVCKKGVALVLEKYETCWTSSYEIHFHRDENEAFREWEIIFS